MDFALNGTSLKDPLTGQLTDEIIDSADCNQLQLALVATGLSLPIKCDTPSDGPVVLRAPASGASLYGQKRSNYRFLFTLRDLIVSKFPFR